MPRDWPHYKALLKLLDFSPISQDLVALQHIRECRALPDALVGRIETAISKCLNIWTSFHDAGYDQREHRLEDLLKQYRLRTG